VLIESAREDDADTSCMQIGADLKQLLGPRPRRSPLTLRGGVASEGPAGGSYPSQRFERYIKMPNPLINRGSRLESFAAQFPVFHDDETLRFGLEK
jgi:hypothetical protein